MWSWTVLSVLFLLGTVFLRTVFLAYMCLTRPCLFKTQRWMSFYYNFYYFRSFSSEYTTCKHVGLFWCFFIFIFYQICMCVCVCVKYKNGILFFFFLSKMSWQKYSKALVNIKPATTQVWYLSVTFYHKNKSLGTKTMLLLPKGAVFQRPGLYFVSPLSTCSPEGQPYLYSISARSV